MKQFQIASVIQPTALLHHTRIKTRSYSVPRRTSVVLLRTVTYHLAWFSSSRAISMIFWYTTSLASIPHTKSRWLYPSTFTVSFTLGNCRDNHLTSLGWVSQSWWNDLTDYILLSVLKLSVHSGIEKVQNLSPHMFWKPSKNSDISRWPIYQDTRKG